MPITRFPVPKHATVQRRLEEVHPDEPAGLYPGLRQVYPISGPGRAKSRAAPVRRRKPDRIRGSDGGRAAPVRDIRMNRVLDRIISIPMKLSIVSSDDIEIYHTSLQPFQKAVLDINDKAVSLSILDRFYEYQKESMARNTYQ